MLTWYLSLLVDSFITYKSVAPTIKMVKKLAPFFVQTTLFIMHHCTEYIVGAIIIAILCRLLEVEVGSVMLFIIGAIYKPVSINGMLILSYFKSSEAISVWVKTVLFQDMVSCLVVFPAIVVTTFLVIKSRKDNAQHSARPVG